MVEFENLPNFRQIGGAGSANIYGKRVKEGLIYRSSEPVAITSKDKGLLLQLGIKSIIDIRGKGCYTKSTTPKLLEDLYTPCEIQDNGQIMDLYQTDTSGNSHIGRHYLFHMYCPKLLSKITGQVNFILRLFSHFVLSPIDAIFGTKLFLKFYGRLVLYHQPLQVQYMDYLYYSSSVILKMLRLLINPDENLPVLIHCVYGKDRTGVLVALIQGCLDIDEETIINDYNKSEEGLHPVREKLYNEVIYDQWVNEWNCKCDRETMEQVLKEVNSKFGSISNYLEYIGFSKDEQLKYY
jgi:protein tyrosine/serine phosphatase